MLAPWNYNIALCSLIKMLQIMPIMLALYLMLLVAYYAYYYAGIINQSLHSFTIPRLLNTGPVQAGLQQPSFIKIEKSS